MLTLSDDQSVLNGRKKLLHGNWLFKERKRTEADSLHCILDCAMAAHHHDWTMQQLALSPFFEQRNTVCVGHPDIQQNKVIPILQNEYTGSLCTVGCVNGVTFIGQDVREHFSDTKFVIDNKNL